MSTPIITRADYQQLADVRLKEAKTLLDSGLWDGAYYLAGYAMEIALKSCIIKKLMRTDAFPERKLSESCYTHDLGKLLEAAGLKPTWDTDVKANPILSGNWGIAKQWSEQTRYHRITELEAKDLYNAVSDAVNGVLPWIKKHW